MKTEFKVPSADGVHTLAGVVYQPVGEIRGYFHVVHGMTEHIARYDAFMTAMAEAGYLTFGYDHLGHGNTARDAGEFGYIAEKHGDDLLVRDVGNFAKAVFAAYGNEKTGRIPYFLMGHSMGSFITRLAIERGVVTPDKYICMGTGGSNPLSDMGLAIIAVMKLFCGEHHVSSLIYRIAFGTYNKRFGNDKEDYNRWLTTDEAVRAAYYADPFCAYRFTLSAMGDLIRLLKHANRGAWFRNLPRIPILLVSGDEDPVGGDGRGVKQVHERLLKQGHQVRCILYPGARHEILNEQCREQVRADILAFLAE